MPQYIPWNQRGAATQLPPAQMAQQLERTWAEETGSLPWRELATLLLAQVLLETAWSKSMWRFNWGNISAGSSWQGLAWRPSWYELTDSSSPRDIDLHEKMLVGQAPSAFRGYNSHAEGAADYIRLLRKRYQGMLDSAKQGDAVAFAKGVRESGYCPDCKDSFVRSIQSLQQQIDAAGWFAHLPSSKDTRLLSPIKVPVSVGAAAVGVVALAGAAVFAARKIRRLPRRRRA